MAINSFILGTQVSIFINYQCNYRFEIIFWELKITNINIIHYNIIR